MSWTLHAALALGWVAVGAAGAQEGFPLRLTPAIHDATWRDVGGGVYEVRTTGADPYILTDSIALPFDHGRFRVFAFEYRCDEGFDFFEVFVGPPWRNQVTRAIPAAPEWRAFASDLGRLPADAWHDGVRDFRVDFGATPERVVWIRNIVLRPMTPTEAEADAARRRAEERRMEDLRASVERSLIAPARLPEGEAEIAARLGLRDTAGTTRIAIVGKQLDLAYQLQRMAPELPAPVELPRAIVVGEGSDPANHTLVRVLSPYGIPEVQFLAYPPQVMGGVQVEALPLPGGETGILTAPLLDASARTIRVFSRYGLPLAEVSLPEGMSAPVRVAGGRFVGDAEGPQVAVASVRPTDGAYRFAVLDLAGGIVAEIAIEVSRLGGGELYAERCGLADGARTGLLLHAVGSPDTVSLDLETRRLELAVTGLPPGATRVSPTGTAPTDSAYVACLEGPGSAIARCAPAAAPRIVGVDGRERILWFTDTGFFQGIPEGRYAKHSRLGHIRTDFASPASGDPDFTRTDAEYWAGGSYPRWVEGRLAEYETEPPLCWEPCFTHRWFAEPGRKWMAATDPETGLPRYVLLDRENRPGFYGEFGQTDAFVTGSYAPGLTAVECMYTHPQRLFLRELAKRFRGNPEHLVAVEPNHEMEINAESPDTHGDYNPQMIRSFCRYLLELYGGVEGINRAFGTDWSAGRFDAPRDLGRGGWDRYAADNPYYRAWMRYLNYVVYRVVAGTYREALLAGFPPEAVKCHQIPDLYAIASLTAFSKPAQRVTPIDWNLTAGVGYGFTRYGVWYGEPHNVVQGAHSSGFDQVVVGEYQSLTPDVEQAYRQLAYMRDHGIQFIHAMTWPAGYNPGSNESLRAAIERIVAEDAPRPGVTGGTGQVREVRQGGGAYEIVSLGTGPEHTGLLKSVNADGSWQGSVYVVPFHAHVAVETVLERESATLGERPLAFGPFAAIDAGNVVDVSFEARGRPGEVVAFRVSHHGVEMPELLTTMELTGDWKPHRFQLRVQIDTDDLTVEMGAGDPEQGSWGAQRSEVRNLLVTRQTERAARIKKGIFAGERHRGGVTFDVLR